MRLLTTVTLTMVLMATPSAAWADDHNPPPKGNNDSTGCCFSFRDSPVILCMTADACRFAAPPK